MEKLKRAIKLARGWMVGVFDLKDVKDLILQGFNLLTSGTLVNLLAGFWASSPPALNVAYIVGTFMMTFGLLSLGKRKLRSAVPALRETTKPQKAAREEPETPPGPTPRIIASDGNGPLRLQIENVGARGTFTAQCKVKGGNTGERDAVIPVTWESGDNGGSADIATGHDKWLRIERDQILATDSPRSPDSPWIDLEVNISTDGGQLVERFLWCSCCGLNSLRWFPP